MLCAAYELESDTVPEILTAAAKAGNRPAGAHTDRAAAAGLRSGLRRRQCHRRAAGALAARADHRRGRFRGYARAGGQGTTAGALGAAQPERLAARAPGRRHLFERGVALVAQSPAAVSRAGAGPIAARRARHTDA